MTRVFALLGDPVGHSLSPALHSAALSAAGLDGSYVALRCGADMVAELMRGLADAGGGGNVTVPHKEVAFSALDAASAEARATCACNTFWQEEGALHGDNTDVQGFAAAKRQLLEGEGRVKRALVLGAGGAARAAVAVLLAEGAEAIVAGRTRERALRLVGELGAGARVGDPYADGPFDLVVNATPLGLHAADPAPVELERVGRVSAVMDLTYAETPSRLLQDAARLGLSASDGREMLVRQAAAAFSIWWGLEAPLEEMRAALRRG
ncbi:MAG: shikimate dehydrogenase [Gemmatimonadota bacterium]